MARFSVEQFARDNDHLHKEYADYIVDGGKRLLNSVSDMLLASDARSGPIALNEFDCTLDELVDLALAPIEKSLVSAKADIRRVSRIRRARTLLRPLAGRPLSSANSSTMRSSSRRPASKITVGAALTKTGDLAILVKDNGSGDRAERLDALTHPFSQTDLSLRRSREGLGLGLPLVNAVMQSHGGKFRLVSEVGQGASAFLIIPASRVRAVASDRSAAA